MSQIDEESTLRHSVEVDVPREKAFWAFVNLDLIKPREHTMLEVEVAETVVEPRIGGGVFDRGVDGSICRWGRVRAFDPPERFAFSWDITPQWQITDDLDAVSEVEVTFTTISEGRTRVDLVHSHLDRHGEGWESERDGVAADDGWPLYLDRFVRSTTGEL